MKKLLLLFIVVSALSGCKDSNQAQWDAMGKKHIIRQYSGGCLINEWTSTGSVSNEEHSDGWYFEDEATGKLVEVTGDITILVK